MATRGSVQCGSGRGSDRDNPRRAEERSVNWCGIRPLAALDIRYPNVGRMQVCTVRPAGRWWLVRRDDTGGE